MPRYQVKAPLNHDMTDYPVDSTVTMTEEQAVPLQTAGVLGDIITDGTLKAGDAIAAAAAAATGAELDELAVNEKRASVLAAIEKRRAELAQG